MPEREAELARGFVLGQDDRIDPRTVEDFRRSGLSHLLAVSGQNVALLALLAMPVLGALGIPLRTRLVWVLALIAVYVPLAGAGPSIQRAAVMGALIGAGDTRRAPLLTPLRAGGRGDRDPRDRAADRGRCRLAAELRRRSRHPAAGGAAAAGDRGQDRVEGGRRGAGRGRGADDLRDACHRAADRLPLRRNFDDNPPRQPPGASRRRSGDVAGDARGGGGPGTGPARRAGQRPRGSPARLHRPGRRLVRAPELGLSRGPSRHRRAPRFLSRDRAGRGPRTATRATSPNCRGAQAPGAEAAPPASRTPPGEHSPRSLERC